MKALKIYAIAVSSGLLVGTLVGWHFGRTITDGRLIWEEMFAAAGYEQLASLLYEEADAEHGRQGLLGLTEFAKSMTKLPSANSDKALLLDAGRTYLRLAAIEELAGNSDLSHQYVLNAQQTFKNMGRDIPRERLDKEVTKIVALARTAKPSS